MNFDEIREALENWWRNLRARPLLAVVLVLAVTFLLNGFVSGRPVETAVAEPTPAPTPADPRFEQFKGTCPSYGPAYDEPSTQGVDREKVFGPPNDPDRRVTITFMGQQVDVHRKVASCLEAVERDLEAQGSTYRVKEIGAYREEREDRPYWFHQYGGAIDINPDTNPICTADLGGDYEGVSEPEKCAGERPYDLPQEWIDTFRRYGFFWGGDFHTGKDYMHFEWHGEAP